MMNLMSGYSLLILLTKLERGLKALIVLMASAESPDNERLVYYRVITDCNVSECRFQSLV